MLALAVFAGSLAAAALLLAAAREMLSSRVFTRVNYAGREVQTSAGVLFVPVYALAYSVVRVLDEARALPVFGLRESLLVLVCGMCLLGLVDDVAGEGGERGFKGHFSALFRGRMTTGMMKAAGGFVIAVAASFPFSPHLYDLALNSALISLLANLFNLLDTRPGRAIKVFLPTFAATAAVTWRLGDAYIPYACSVLAVALVLFPGDLAERHMLGDAGSNVLGAVIGLGLAAAAGVWWRLGVLVLVLALTLLSERYSFTAAVDRNRVLSRLDALGRKGESGRSAKY